MGSRRRLLTAALVAVLIAGCAQLDDDPVEQPTQTGERVFTIATVTPMRSPTPRTTNIEYTVQEGDTLSGIADLFGVSQDDIARANNLSDIDAIHAGQVLLIPPETGGTPAP